MKRFWSYGPAAIAVAAAALLAACGGHGGSNGPLPNAPMPMVMPSSVSPADIPVKPMAMTAVQPASAMPLARADGDIQSLGYTQIPGTASQAAASPDGTLWVLAAGAAGADKAIWHYNKGSWVNIPGAATQISVAPDGSLYAINSGGGTYHYQNSAWTSLGGGASALAAASDGSVYVLSNAGAGPDRAIWQNKAGTWTQKPGAGTVISASWDWGTYTSANGTFAPSGIYIINSAGNIYYLNADGTTYASLPGSASSVAATTGGGLFALGYPTNAGGNPLYYNNLSTGAWSIPGGSGISISSNGQALYVIATNGAIYQAPVTPVTSPAPSATLPPIEFVSRTSGNHYWGPWSSANAFNFPVQSGYNGTGITVAIIIDAVPSMSDMTYQMNFFGVNRTGQITTRPVDGGGTNPDQDGEATLDAETIAGGSPGANVIIYNIPDLSNAHIVDAYNAVISDGRANVLSMSFGGCEYNGSKSVENPIFNTMNAAGIAIVAASGDSGNACYYNGTLWPTGPQSPASDPNIIGVGGTQTDPSTDTIVSNAIWNDCNGTPPSSKGDNCMSSGGVSGYFTPPPYQVGLAGTVSSGRDVPDISLPGDGVLIRFQGANYSFGGTSWSAPLSAALIAQIYQYCQVTAMPNAVRMFYDTFSAVGYAAFDDVTTGNDQYFDANAPNYSAAAGYDLVGGIGQPLGMPIAQHICPGRVFSPLGGGMRVATSAVLSKLPAQARTFDDRIDLRDIPGLVDAGPRAGDATTRLVVAMRPTSTVHQDEATVASELAKAGFTIVQRFPNAGAVDIEGPASLVSSYFGTALHDYRQPGFGARFANVTPITIPASIAPFVNGVITDDLVTKSYGPVRKVRV